MNTLQNSLGIYVNGRRELDLCRSGGVPGRRRQFLEQMDRDMDKGITMHGQTIASPDTGQRARYVTMQLLRALDRGNRGLADTLGTWLASRLPQLKAVHAEDTDGTVTVEFDFGSPDN